MTLDAAHRETETGPVDLDRSPGRPVWVKVLDFFSGIRLCVVLLSVLFVYCAIGSAGFWVPLDPSTMELSPIQYQQIRQWPIFEMTEFEWFHTWAFYAICGLICLNMSLATIRRVPLDVLRAGTWMIHGGIIVMTVGAVIYFSQKIEGDSPVLRREVLISVPGHVGATMPAIEGSSVSLRGKEGTYRFAVDEINPNWPILSGTDEGETTYSVSVRVMDPEGDTWIRQLLAGYPQYTEDIIPGEGRAKNIERFGRAIIDDTIALNLGPAVQEWFWVKDSSALYLRPQGGKQWSERPLIHMPRYNDYIPTKDAVFAGPQVEDGFVRDLDVPGVVDESDAFPEVSARVVGFLRYATMDTRVADAEGAPLNPVADLRIFGADGAGSNYELVAFDAERAEGPGGAVRFNWIDDPDLIGVLDEGYSSVLTIRVPEYGVDMDVPFRVLDDPEGDTEFVEIEGTPYSYRVLDLLPQFAMPGGRSVSLAIVEFDTPEGRLQRWVSNDPSITRDLTDGAHESQVALDPRFETSYNAVKLGTVTLIAGPEGVVEPRVVVLNPTGTGTLIAREVEVGGAPISLGIQDLQLRVQDLTTHGMSVTKPQIVPPEQRERNVDQAGVARMALVEVDDGQRKQRKWTRFHRYAFDRDLEYNSFGQVTPTTFVLSDGTPIEVLFSRERERLPNPVMLEDFVLETHEGGYDGTTVSVRNWLSQVRFMRAGGEWSEVNDVKANSPSAFNGMWFFQASWDPPQQPGPDGTGGSPGLNHTGLGVGNREGVITMLVGTTLSVIGMIYAFYIKPVIKRRRRDAKHRELEAKGELPMRSTDPLDDVDEGRRGRGRLAVMFGVGVLVASVIAGLGFWATLSSAKPKGEGFERYVDLGPLDRSAVHTKGRIKSFDSFANELLGFVTGPERIESRPRDFTYMDMLLAPERYADQATIYVKKKPVRRSIADAAELLLHPAAQTEAVMSEADKQRMREALERFMDDGLITNELLALPTVRNVLSRMSDNVVTTAKAVQAIQTAQRLQDPQVLATQLRLIPPPTGHDKDPWLSVGDLFASSFGVESPLQPLLQRMDPAMLERLRGDFLKLGNAWHQGVVLEERGPRATQFAPETLILNLLTWAEQAAPVHPQAAGLTQQTARELEAMDEALTNQAAIEALDGLITEIESLEQPPAASRTEQLLTTLLEVELTLPADALPERIRKAAERVNTGIADFCATLPEVAPELYPSQTQLNLESYYFKAGGMVWIWIIYLLSMLFLLMAIVYKWAGARAIGMGLFASGFLAHTVALGWRWYVSGRWPNSNMFEAVTTSVWLGTLCVLALEIVARRTPLKNLFALGAAGASMVAMMSADFLPQLDPNIGNMMPILHDLWLYIHTNVIIASYALIFMAAVTSVLYLGWRMLGGPADHATIGGTDMLLRTSSGYGPKRKVSAGQIFDGATMIMIELSFVMLWAGIVMGAIWADHSWGRPWGWDPKEVFALNTFLVYLVLIHARLKAKDKGLWTAILSIIGCGTMLFNWIVINFVISGLHSYA